MFKAFGTEDNRWDKIMNYMKQCVKNGSAAKMLWLKLTHMSGVLFFLKLPNMEICSDKGTSINDVTFFPRYFNPFEVNSIGFLQAIGM